MLPKCAPVERVTGEHNRARISASDASHDGIDGRDGAGAAGRRTQTGRFAGLGLVNLADLAGA
ncbi:MAG: hypothetical protein M3Y17_11170 [Actinomycetota bacterium]|nr:hypothetical protein [Actinomycetota bacterium]